MQEQFNEQARRVALAYIGFTSAAESLYALAAQMRDAGQPDNSNFPTLGRVPATRDNPQLVELVRDFVGRGLLTREEVDDALPLLLN